MVFTSTTPLSYVPEQGLHIVVVSPGKTFVNTSVVARVVRRHARIGAMSGVPSTVEIVRGSRPPPLMAKGMPMDSSYHTCFPIRPWLVHFPMVSG